MIISMKRIKKDRPSVEGSPHGGGRDIGNRLTGQKERAMSAIGIRHRKGKGVLLGNEGGFVLVLSLVIFFTLTLLGLTSLMNSNIEIQISGNENAGNLSLYSAEAGLNHALTLLNTNPGIIDYSNVNTWYYYYPDNDSDTTSFDNIDHDLDNDSRYRWSMHFKQDTEDLDSDSDTDERVYFNQHFGYGSSLYANDGEGWPVIEVISEGRWGTNSPSERRLALELGRNKLNVAVEGSLTARSDVEISGNITVDGHNHDINGNLGGSCGTDMPGVYVDVGKTVTTTGSGDAQGDPPIVVNDGSNDMPKTPEGVLGVDVADLFSLFTRIDAAASGYNLDMLNGDIWVHNIPYGTVMQINANSNVGGILMVHNDNFHPDVWDVSNPASPSYDTSHADYNPMADPSDAAFDDSYSPAEFQVNGNATFKGVIIADKVIRMNGNATIIGAVVSLDSLGVHNVGLGSAEILYSCEAITQFTDRGYATKLVWRRL
jgi:hypothetical protein